MSYPLYRHGTYALIDGVSHRVSYSFGENYVHFPDGASEKPTPYPRSEPIPVDMCERVFSVQVYASYRGHGVLIDELDESGKARLMEAEWDGEWATVNGFVQENAYEYYKTADIHELTGYYEKQTDLLFTRWREAHFSRPLEGLTPTGGWANGDPAVISGRPRTGIVKDEDGRLAEVTTRAEYFGYPCEIAGITADGSVGLYYLGPDEAQAEADGFQQVYDGRWAKTAHIYDLARYHEHHVDQLFDSWRTGSELPYDK